MLVVFKFKEGKFEKYMGFMQSDAGLAKEKNLQMLQKLGSRKPAPDKKTFMAKIVVHNIDALHAFLDGSNQCL